MRALGLGAFLQHRRASGPRRRPTSDPRPRVPHVVDPGCVGVEASTPHQPWVPSRDPSGTPVGTLLGVSLPPYACSALPPLRARVKGRVGVSPRERDAVRVRVGCGWCSTRRLSLCAVAGWPQQRRWHSCVCRRHCQTVWLRNVSSVAITDSSLQRCSDVRSNDGRLRGRRGRRYDVRPD